MQPGAVLHHGLVTITAEAAVAIAAAQLPVDRRLSAGAELFDLNPPGRVANHGQTATVDLLAG